MSMQIKIKSDISSFCESLEMISNEITNVELCWKQLQEIFEKMDAYWQGSAGKAHYRYYLDVANEVSKLLHRMKNAQHLLGQQSGIAIKNEEPAEENKLPADVLV